MKLQTLVPLNSLQPLIDYHSKVVLLGSCFTENIGGKLQYYGFHTTVNPFGIIFNPVSLAQLITRAVNKSPYTRSDVENTFSYLAHSALNGENTQQVTTNLNHASISLCKSLQTASHVFITLGTSWVYELKATQQIVANCHKQPQALFNKRLLSLQEISDALEAMVTAIQHINQQAHIVFTLSPVRHLKDGFIENQRSKARLHECLQRLVEHNKARYFPAYEIVMDELRDYRYYARDMMHLNELGIDYVWERFRESVINTSAQHTMKSIHKYQQLKNHRPHNLEKHIQQLQRLRQDLIKTYPNIVFYEK